MGNSATRGNPLSAIVLLLFLIYGLSLSGCGGSGGISPSDGASTTAGPQIPAPKQGEKDALDSGIINSNIQLSCSGVSVDGTLCFRIALRDENGNPIYVKKNNITAYYSGQAYEAVAAPPATDPAKEEENQRAISEGRYNDLCFDNWLFVSTRLTGPGDYQFGVVIEVDGKKYTNQMVYSVSNSDVRRAGLRTTREGAGYNGPPANYYGTGVASLTIPSQEYNPGDTVTANVNLYGGYWASSAWVSCSYADPTSIKVDGVLTAGQTGSASYYSRWTLPEPQPDPDPSYKVWVNGAGVHTVEFKLDPRYENKYFTYNATAYGGVGEWSGPFVCLGKQIAGTSWDDCEGFIIKPLNRELRIENQKADPEEFTPPDETTVISAQIVADTFEADSIEWQVVIKGDTDAIVRTFDTRTASGAGPWAVNETWDAKNDAGELVDYGDYTFTIKAKAMQGTETYEAEVSGSVKVVPPMPTLTEFIFQKTIDIADDDGKDIKPIFYSLKGQSAEENPVAIALENLTPSEETSGVKTSQPRAILPMAGKCDMSFELPFAPAKPGTYEIKIMSSTGYLLVKNLYLPFKAGEKKLTIKDGQYTVPDKIQKIEAVRIYYKAVKPIPNGGWKDITDWSSDRVIPKEPIWITFAPPKPPLDIRKQKIRRGLLDIACFIAADTQNPKDASEQMVSGLHYWLYDKGFYYDKRSPHGGFVEITHGKKTVTTYRFNYKEFMSTLPKPGDEIPSGNFKGECNDVSSLFVLCCTALGVEMELNGLRMPPSTPQSVFLTYPVMTCGRQEWRESAIGAGDWAYRNPDVVQWPFAYHQVAASGSNVWDPLLEFQSTTWGDNFAVSASKADYKNCLIEVNKDYANWVRPTQEEPNQINFKLDEPIFP